MVKDIVSVVYAFKSESQSVLVLPISRSWGSTLDADAQRIAGSPPTAYLAMQREGSWHGRPVMNNIQRS